MKAIDFDNMSGLANFGNYHDYNLFFKNYQDFCNRQPPIFQCLPYNEPPVPQIGQMMMQGYPQNIPNYNPGMFPPNPYNVRLNNNPKRNGFNPPQYNYMNNNRFPMNNGYNNIQNNNNKRYFDYKNNIYNNKQIQNNNKFNNNDENDNGNNKIRQITPRQEFINNNQKFFVNQNYDSSFNININMNQNPQMLRYPLPPQQQMMLMYKKKQMMDIKKINDLTYQFQNMNLQNKESQNNYNNYMNYPKNDPDKIDQRNLQNLNPSQLHSQFNKPPISLIPNMFNSKEQEDSINEIADSIYEIVYSKYPGEASKITGMIKEKGYEKMNMLLSQKEDLYEIIDTAHELINNSKKNIDEDNQSK